MVHNGVLEPNGLPGFLVCDAAELPNTFGRVAGEGGELVRDRPSGQRLADLDAAPGLLSAMARSLAHVMANIAADSAAAPAAAIGSRSFTVLSRPIEFLVTVTFFRLSRRRAMLAGVTTADRPVTLCCKRSIQGARMAGSDGVQHRRRLSQALRRARRFRGLTQEQVAEELGCSLSKVRRIESGDSSVSKTDLKAMLQLYGVTDEQLVDESLETARRSRQASWTREYSDVATKSFMAYLDFEHVSAHLRSYESTYIPGPLQTEPYARAIITLHSPPATEPTAIERLVELRMNRQRLLRPQQEKHFIVDESALLRRVGVRSVGPQVMQDQLRKIFTAMREPQITVQVLPLAAGEHPGMRLGSFVHLRFADPADRDLVFHESATGDATEHVPIENAWPYEKAFIQLQELALDPDASRTAINAILRDLHGHDP